MDSIITPNTVGELLCIKRLLSVLPLKLLVVG